MGFLEMIGRMVFGLFAGFVRALEAVGQGIALFMWTVIWTFRPPFRFRELMRQLDFVGVRSVEIIAVTGMFTGMVLALQGYVAVSKFGAQSLVGGTVALALARELGPVLSALMVTGRAGSAMTAELGTMRITQQIDALAGMAVEPIQYLVVPRVIASTLMLPLLAVLFCLAGVIGAYGVFIFQLGGDGGVFVQSVRDLLSVEDIAHGLTKSVVFGTILSAVCCSKGFFATGGSRGVGLATTRAVVVSSLLVLASDYVMTSIMFHV